jgi:hypothetical protein
MAWLTSPLINVLIKNGIAVTYEYNSLDRRDVMSAIMISMSTMTTV